MIRKRRELLLAAASLLFTLLVLEAGARVLAWRRQEAAFEDAVAHTPPLARDGLARLIEIIRPSRQRRLVYELRPGLDLLLKSVRDDRPDSLGVPTRVRTNAAGFRDREYADAKPPGGVRVLGLGDSFMFGWGVPEGDDYLSRLEARLTAERPERRFEVINTAVPGYNTVMEVEALELKGLRYAPDVVVLGFVHNDLDLPNFLLRAPDLLSVRTSFLWRFVSARAGAASDALLVLAPRREAGRLMENDPGRVPPAYRELAGWDPFEAALRELRGLSQAHGFQVIVLAIGPRPAPFETRALQTMRALGFGVVDAGEAQAAHLAAHGLTNDVGPPLTLGAADPHPSSLSHALAAERLFDELARRFP